MAHHLPALPLRPEDLHPALRLPRLEASDGFSLELVARCNCTQKVGRRNLRVDVRMACAVITDSRKASAVIVFRGGQWANVRLEVQLHVLQRAEPAGGGEHVPRRHDRGDQRHGHPRPAAPTVSSRCAGLGLGMDRPSIFGLPDELLSCTIATTIERFFRMNLLRNRVDVGT